MVVVQKMPPAVRKYLEQIELELKQLVGVSPEEALSDAREFLMQDAAALARSGEEPDEDAHWRHILQEFGEPKQVALQYATPVELRNKRLGYAPGWRICCTKCGRSAPLAAIGGIRIAAKSCHKYTLGYCRGCGWLRWMRIQQDLERTNLTDRLGVSMTTDQLRSTSHRPLATIFGILALVAVVLFTVWALTAGLAKGDDSRDAAVEKFRHAVEQNYSYRDARGVNWENRIGEFRDQLLAAPDAIGFANVAAECLREAHDVHIWLKVGERTVGTYQHGAQPNFNPRVLPKLLEQWKQHGKTVITGSFKEGTRYVLTSTWDNREPSSMQAAVNAVREAARAKKPLIIDVRPNMGGDELQARKVAGIFVTKPTPYAAHTNWANGQIGPKQQRLLEPDTEQLFHPGPCVVLMGPVNMSSCEAFLLMMRAAGAQLIGMKSLGASGNPKPHDLGNGVTVFLPSWQSLDVKGQSLHGIGIQPDTLVKTNPNDFATADPVIDQARKLIGIKPKTPVKQ